jgi:ribonuclease HI
MPWRTAILRGTKVFARCDANGALLEEDGKVEIRYRQGDSKAYRALARNLGLASGEKVLPDEHCGAAEPAPKVDARVAAAVPGQAVSGGPSKRTKSAPKSAAVESDPERVVAYTDGACSGNPGPAGLGVVLVDDGERRELSEYLGVATNNVAELTAILRALEAIEPERAALLHTDSQYAIGVLTKNWKPKVNQELIERIKQRLRQFSRLKFVYVPGHAGLPLNERADALARAAVAGRASAGWQSVLGRPEPRV